MNSLMLLMEKQWILRDEDRELYYKVKYEINTYQKFIQNHLGWRLIHNENLIRLEKVPSHALPFMGINEFTDRRDYCILCALLMFLEDRFEEKTFLLSELIRYVETVLVSSMSVDWTVFSQRRSLVRVVQYAEQMHMIRIFEGDTETFARQQDAEVLYENTGYSKYFALQYPIDVTRFEKWQDFEEKMMEELDDDKGNRRINRVYRTLCLSPILLWKDQNDPDGLYVKNQRKAIRAALQKNMEADLYLSRNGASLVYQMDGAGAMHPRRSMISDIVTLVSKRIAENALDGRKMKVGQDDCITIKSERFNSILMEVRNRYEKLWGKEFRSMSDEKYIASIRQYMKSWMMIIEEEDEVIITPACVMVTGSYPKDLEERTDE